MQSFTESMGAFGKETSILNRFLFPAPAASYSWASFEGELMCLVGKEGNIVPCAVMPGMSSKIVDDPMQPFMFDDPASNIVIYCHANGEDVGVLYEAGHWLCDTLGVHVLIPEYPGYGVAPDSPNELSVNRNILAAYDFAVKGLHWDPKRVIFFGRSIGTGPAVKLASELECGGLILVSPYTSIKDLVSQHAGIVTSWLTAELANLYPSDECISYVKCPSLIVHGATDRVIPCEQARRLHAKSGSKAKRLVVLEGIGHHGIDLHFAVAHECPRLFDLTSSPRYLEIDNYLADPALQGDTVASPVPVFDCRSSTWSRPTLERGTAPFLREPPEGSRAHHYAEDPTKNKKFELYGYQQRDVNGKVTGYIVTDDVLLAHLNSEIQVEHEQFIKARETSPGTRPVRHFHSSNGMDLPAPLLEKEDTDAYDSAMLELRTDERGQVVRRPINVPPSGPGATGCDPKLFVY
uniref:Serine aminopeptidase S33 domain-containing protein n=1 Tax=Hanusia phi TaxID=3032 RepID=A0A7S0HWG4_9CRYP|mmetsp:Transcript_5030/g.11890  ORF Transcript_5030/g.11890 Transcript_5030/m.11890 type:complete len:464 (+) Transcript_5030:164-1555(+)